MKGFSALVVLAMGSTTAVGGTLGWTSGSMTGILDAGVTPSGPLTFIVTPTMAHPVSSIITITSSAKIFAADGDATKCTVTCADACTSPAVPTLTCTTTGNILACTTAAGALTASAVTIECAGNLAANPAAAAITFTATSNLDAVTANAANAGYTTTTAGTTLGWTSGLMAGTLVPAEQAVGPLTFIVTPTQAHPAGSVITITSSAKIFAADGDATKCTVTCADACTSPAAPTLACDTSGTGTILVCTTAAGALTKSVVTIVCDKNLAVNPAAGDVTFAAVSSLDTSSAAATNVGYTTAAAKIATTNATNATNATKVTTNATNVTTTASLLINSAASVVSPGAVAFLLASLY